MNKKLSSNNRSTIVNKKKRNPASSNKSSQKQNKNTKIYVPNPPRPSKILTRKSTTRNPSSTTHAPTFTHECATFIYFTKDSPHLNSSIAENIGNSGT